MADLPQGPDSNGDTGVGPGSGPTPGAPRWVYALGIIALVRTLNWCEPRTSRWS